MPRSTALPAPTVTSTAYTAYPAYPNTIVKAHNGCKCRPVGAVVWEPFHQLQGGRLMRRGPGQTDGHYHDHSLFGSSCRRFLFYYPTCPSRYLVFWSRVSSSPSTEGWMVEVRTYEPGKVPHTLLRCTVRTQGRQPRQVSIQKSSGSLQGPLLPLTHTTFLHPREPPSTRDEIDHLEQMNRSSRD